MLALKIASGLLILIFSLMIVLGINDKKEKWSIKIAIIITALMVLAQSVYILGCG